MAYSKLADLTTSLYQRTIEGKIDWEITTMDGVYQTSLANHSIQISLQPSRTAEGDDIRISIINDEGNEVESFLDVDMKMEWFNAIGEDQHPYKIMLEFYHLVRRTALGAEKTISDILGELNDD